MSPHLEESPHGAAAADGDQIRYSAGLDAAIGRPPLVTGEGGIGNRWCRIANRWDVHWRSWGRRLGLGMRGVGGCGRAFVADGGLENLRESFVLSGLGSLCFYSPHSVVCIRDNGCGLQHMHLYLWYKFTTNIWSVVRYLLLYWVSSCCELTCHCLMIA